MRNVTTRLEELLGEEASYLLDHTCQTIPKEHLHPPGGDFVSRVWASPDRPIRVLDALQALFDSGRLAGTGYLSILPVDHAMAYSAGSAFAGNPAYFDPENIVRLALEGGCSALLTSFGMLGAVARKYAHRIPFILKLNHHDTLAAREPDQIRFAGVEDAWNMGCTAVGATVYFGSPESGRQLVEVSEAFSLAHQRGLATILFCYLHNAAFRMGGINHELSADLTGQANHLGVTIEADIIKQKLPTHNGGFKALNTGTSSYGKLDERIYTALTSEHPVDLTRYQVVNCYLGRCGLINSGGGSGQHDLQEAVRTAVINKRAGGMGLISGRKAFQRPLREGVELLQAIRDVYLNDEVSVA